MTSSPAPNSSPPSVLIHPGYPKSGSTSLQKNIFQRHPDLHCVFPNPAHEAATALFREITHNRDRNMTTVEREWAASITPTFTPLRLNVISNERMLSGHRDPTAVCRDFKRLVPEARVLIVFRPQIELLRSIYDMFPFERRDPKRRPLKFSVWLEKTLAHPRESIAGALDYSEVVDAYASAYGPHNVFGISLQRLAEDEQAQRACAQFIGLNPHDFRARARRTAPQYHQRPTS